VKITSDAPKSFPLVHHLPSIDAGEELVWFVGREAADVVRVEGARTGGFEEEPGFGAGLLGAVLVVPPAG
jgi:hypothetical protein